MILTNFCAVLCCDCDCQCASTRPVSPLDITPHERAERDQRPETRDQKDDQRLRSAQREALRAERPARRAQQHLWHHLAELELASYQQHRSCSIHPTV